MFTAELKNKANEDICILIKLDNHSWNYMLDCGQASGLSVKDCQDTRALFISHGHIDHLIDFDKLLRYQLETRREMVICGPKNIHQQIQSKIKGYTWNLIKKGSVKYQIREILDEKTVDVYETEPPEWELKKISRMEAQPIFKNERFSVGFTILDHKTPSIAYLFQQTPTLHIKLEESGLQSGKWIKELKEAYEKEEGNKEIEIAGEIVEAKNLFRLLELHKGDSLGYIMDHAASPANHKKIQALFTGCNKVFIETFYKESDKDFAEVNHHSYSKKSAEVMHKCNVKEAIPVHFSRKYVETDIQELIGEFEVEFYKNQNGERS